MGSFSSTNICKDALFVLNSGSVKAVETKRKHELSKSSRRLTVEIYAEKNCRCTRGQLHTSLYIQKTSDRKTKKALIPKARWKEVKEMNDRYKEILQLLEIISDYQWEHIRDKK